MMTYFYQINKEEIVTGEQFLSSFDDLELFFDDPRRRLVVPQDDVNVKDADVLEVVTFRADEEVEGVATRLAVVVFVDYSFFVDFVGSEKRRFCAIDVNFVWCQNVDLKRF
jgi:hypothetical protein